MPRAVGETHAAMMKMRRAVTGLAGATGEAPDTVRAMHTAARETPGAMRGMPGAISEVQQCNQ